MPMYKLFVTENIQIHFLTLIVGFEKKTVAATLFKRISNEFQLHSTKNNTTFFLKHSTKGENAKKIFRVWT